MVWGFSLPAHCCHAPIFDIYFIGEKRVYTVNNNYSLGCSSEESKKKMSTSQTQQEEQPDMNDPFDLVHPLSLHLSPRLISIHFGLSPQPPSPLETTFPIRFLSPSFPYTLRSLHDHFCNTPSLFLHHDRKKRGIRMNTNTGGLK